MGANRVGLGDNRRRVPFVSQVFAPADEGIRMRSRLVAAAIAVAALSVAAPPAQAAVHTPAAAVQSHAVACKYKRDGKVWRCVTPGAYCPKAARGKYGYAKVTKKRYKCVKYSKTTWRWKRA